MTKHRQALQGDRARNRRLSTAQQSSQRRSDKEQKKNMLEGTADGVQELGGDAEVHESGQVGQHAVKEICTKMVNPTRGYWKRLKKACRCMRRVEKVTWVMRGGNDGMTVDVHVD